MSLLVAWRMRDMWPKLEKFLKEMEILARLETREQAVIACAEHDTDIEGRNNPVRTHRKPPFPPEMRMGISEMWGQPATR